MKSMKSTVERTDEEEILQILGEKSPVGVCIIQDGKFCYFNSNFPIAIGYTADELVGKDPLELIVPEDREVVRENEIKMLKGEILSPYQFRVIHKDGSIRWVMEAVRSIEYHGRRAVLGSYMEVTERKQMEEALKESEEKYRELANSITNVFFAMDEHLRYTYWNSASEILTGIRAGDAIGKSIREVFQDTDWRRKAEKIYRKVLKTQQPQTFVNDYDIDNRHYILEISAYPSRGGISVFVKDITERKLAEEKLKESEQKYRLLFETSLDCIAQLDREGRYLAANPATAKSLGVPLEELIGKTVSEVVPQEVAQLRLENMKNVLDEWQPQIFEDERAGRCFHHIVIPIKTSEQKEAVQVITRDITERRQAEEALRQSEERYRTILEEMEDSYFEVDLGGHLTFVNSATCRKLGYSKKELIGMSYKKTTLEDDIDSVFRIFNEVYRTGKPNKSCLWTTVCKDGTHRLIEHSAFPLRNDKGEIIGFRGVGRDITERKQAEDKLQSSEERYRALFDSSVIGTLLLDAETMQVLMGNEAAAKIFGFSSLEEGAGINVLDFVPQEDRELNRELMKRELFEQDSRQDYDVRAITKDGREIWINVTGVRMMYKGRLVGMVTFTDVTERKQAEEALQAEKNKLQSLVDAMEDGLTIQDRDYNIIYEGRLQRMLYGDHLGEKCYRVYEGREKICKGCPVEKAFKDGKSHTAERTSVLPSGEVTFWENTANPIRDAYGKIVSCLEVSRNITERKKQEQALADELTQRRLLFDKSLDGIVVLDENDKVYEANQRFAEMLGYTPEEVRELHTWDWDKNYSREQIHEMGRNVDEKGLHLETKHTRKDGSVIDVDISISGIMYGGRKLIFCIQRDVTERNRAEEKLKLLSSVTQQVSDATIITAADFNIIYVNKAAQDLFGYSPEEMLGKHMGTFNAEPLPKSREQELEQTLSSDKPWIGTLIKKRKDGSTFLCECRITPLHDDEGKISSYIDVMRDVTERKQAEEALRRSEERYRTILEEMEDSYFEVDLGGHLTFVNSATCRALGYSREELIGKSYKDYTAEEDIESVFQIFNEVYQTGVPNKGFAWKTIRKDGVQGFAETSVSPLRNDKGEIIGFRGVGRDVTERKQAEEALRQSEENYKTLFNSAVVGMYVMDAETMQVVMGNRAAREIIGFSSAEEGIGVNPFDFVVPEDREKVLEIAINEFFQDSRQTHEIRVMDKNGRKRWQSISIARIMHRGRLASLVSFTDITERKQMEEALRQSEENYRALFDSSVIGTFVLDAETMKVVMGNEAAMKLAGLDSPSEGIGINPFDFAIPEERERILEIVNKELFEQDLRRIHEFRAITKDGKKIWISITGARIMHGGKLAGLISFTDITERKRMEEALRQSEENYRALFDSSVIGTIVLDFETMQVVMANKAAVEAFSFSSVEEAIGVNPLDFIPSEDKERVSELITKDLFEQDLRTTQELRVITKDGREIWISATGARIMHEGKLAGLISFTDITEQKQQRERLMMTDRLASLGEMAAGTAHELNNPLTSIIGFSQLLMDREVPDDICDDLKLIYSEAQRAAKVTKDLLTFARKHAPMKQPNQINSIIDDVLQLRAHVQENRGIEVERHLAPDLPEIMVDYFQMQQVFLNIIINAEYFMTETHNKGTLTITTKNQNNSVIISFADDGPGIPLENLKRIFDPFFTTKEAGKGTGLGLSICHGIVIEHGGQIYVRSQLGKGATIFVELPIDSRDHIKRML